MAGSWIPISCASRSSAGPDGLLKPSDPCQRASSEHCKRDSWSSIGRSPWRLPDPGRPNADRRRTAVAGSGRERPLGAPTTGRTCQPCPNPWQWHRGSHGPRQPAGARPSTRDCRTLCPRCHGGDQRRNGPGGRHLPHCRARPV